MNLVCPHVPIGTVRFADVPKILAASVDKCKVAVDVWDREVKSRPEDEICNGLFLASYRTNHFFRRCDAAKAEGGYCTLCAKMRSKAEGKQHVTVADIPEYAIVRHISSVENRFYT